MHERNPDSLDARAMQLAGSLNGDLRCLATLWREIAAAEGVEVCEDSVPDAPEFNVRISAATLFKLIAIRDELAEPGERDLPLDELLDCIIELTSRRAK